MYAELDRDRNPKSLVYVFNGISIQGKKFSLFKDYSSLNCMKSIHFCYFFSVINLLTKLRGHFNADIPSLVYFVWVLVSFLLLFWIRIHFCIYIYIYLLSILFLIFFWSEIYIYVSGGRRLEWLPKKNDNNEKNLPRNV